MRASRRAISAPRSAMTSQRRRLRDLAHAASPIPVQRLAAEPWRVFAVRRQVRYSSEAWRPAGGSARQVGASRMTGHIDPTKEAFAAFRADDRPGPIHMLNLVRLRARAAYPDGREATGRRGLCGLRARKRAGVLAARRVDRLARPVRTDADRTRRKSAGISASSPSTRASRLSSP